jgi:hypothetical protein
LSERRNKSLYLGIVFVEMHEHANALDAVALARSHYERPRRGSKARMSATDVA